jgi:NAD(P)-dependent dehydrogenase (short-subunit alcohol dehydrogenase family)
VTSFFLTFFLSESMDNDRQSVTDPESRSASGISPWPFLIAGGGIAVAMLARAPRYNFRDKVVLITGGSRGLGLVLARQLADRGAAIGLLARDPGELARARETIWAPSEVQLLAADVTSRSQVEQAVSNLVKRFGRIDVVINNAGQILSAPFDDTTDADFKGLLDVHVWGTLNVTRAALPHLARHGDGRVINICSIGSRIPVPHLSAYCTSKFAQAGLSAVMAEELREKGIRVTTIMPGLMRTGSHVHAWFKGDPSTEFAMFSLVGGLPGTSMGADRAARQILDAAARGQSEAIIPFTVRQVARATALFPNLAIAALRTVTRLLPPPGSQFAVQGQRMTLNPAIRAVVALNERAADRNNER